MCHTYLILEEALPRPVPFIPHPPFLQGSTDLFLVKFNHRLQLGPAVRRTWRRNEGIQWRE